MTKKPGDTRHRRPTMTEVARKAGVSQTSVSLVLNNAGGVRVAEATREKVRKAAEELGYHVWRRAPIGAGSIRSIGLLIDDIGSNPLSSAAIEAARRRAWEHGCVLTVVPIHGDKTLERAGIDLLFAQRLVGVIYQSFFTQKVTLPKKLRTAPLILLNCYTSDPNVAFIVPDHEQGAVAATSELIGYGHRRIAFINGDPTMEAARLRLNGYRAAMRTAGLPVHSDHVVFTNWQVSDAHAATLALLHKPSPPTAFFCASDKLALGCYEALKGEGFAVAKDFSVVGFDDDPMAQYLSPPLTTVQVPHALMGERAIDFLVGQTSHEGALPQAGHKIGCPLIRRQSVGEKISAAPGLL